MLGSLTMVSRRLAEHAQRGRRLTVRDQHLGELLEQPDLLTAMLERLPERDGRLRRVPGAGHGLGVLREIQRRLTGEPVGRMQLGQMLEHGSRGQVEAQHLLAHRDRVLVQQAALVHLHGLQIPLGGARRLALLVEQIGEQDEVVGVGVRTLDETPVLTQGAVQITALDASLCASLDVDRLFQVRWLSRLRAASVPESSVHRGLDGRGTTIGCSDQTGSDPGGLRLHTFLIGRGGQGLQVDLDVQERPLPGRPGE